MAQLSPERVRRAGKTMDDLERLWNYYAAGRVVLPRPRYLCFNATLRCDGRCRHCGIWSEDRPGPELSAAEVGRLLSAPFFSRIETAWITGGEPTLREDLGELAQAMARSLPALFTLGLATNALAPERVLDRVRAMLAALDHRRQSLFLHLSLDGIGEVHDRVRRKPGAFAALLEAIAGFRNLRREYPPGRLELGLNCVIQPENLSGLPGLFSFAKEQGLPLLFNLVLVTDQIYRNEPRRASLSFSSEQRQELLRFLERIIPESPRPFQYHYEILRAVLSGRPRPRRCLTLYTTMNINADGTWIPCPATSDLFPKKLRPEEVEEMWRSREVRQFRRRVHREYCPICPLSCSLGDALPFSEWRRGGWDPRPILPAAGRETPSPPGAKK